LRTTEALSPLPGVEVPSVVPTTLELLRSAGWAKFAGRQVIFLNRRGGHYRLNVCSYLRKSAVDFPHSRLYFFFVDRDDRSTSLLTARGGWINAA